MIDSSVYHQYFVHPPLILLLVNHTYIHYQPSYPCSVLQFVTCLSIHLYPYIHRQFFYFILYSSFHHQLYSSSSDLPLIRNPLIYQYSILNHPLVSLNISTCLASFLTSIINPSINFQSFHPSSILPSIINPSINYHSFHPSPFLPSIINPSINCQSFYPLSIWILPWLLRSSWK